ncbi:MAG TPA: peptidase MA family metallohydrolase [Polyangiaceae bacterium]|nr:peptidase MA family metallohydrolase [Polyangiaceae bacterium]
MGRIAARLIIWCLSLLFLAAGNAFAAPGDLVPPPPAAAEAREGRTELAPPRAGSKTAEDPVDVASTVNGLPSSVADAPRVGRGVLRMPATPAGFNSYDAGWVRFIYHPSSRERVQPLIAQAEAVRHDLTERLGFPVLSEVRVQIARTPGEMATFAPSGAPYPEYAAGVAYSELGLVLLSLTPIHAGQEAQDLAEVFRHELAHVALHDALNGQDVPRWFNEGFAVFASGESSFGRMKTLAMSTVGGSLIPLHELERSFPNDETKAQVAYAEAVDVVRFLVRREDVHRFRTLVSELREGKPFDQAVLDAYAIDLATLELEWRDDASRRYTFVPILLSGTFFWIVALALAVWAWRRRKRRDKLTLQRWAREEAVEDLQRARLALRTEAARVHIVLAKNAEIPVAQMAASAASEVEVPVVEHDGSWHTLH